MEKKPHILQVRPIAAHKQNQRIYDEDFLKEIAAIQNFVENKLQPRPNQFGSTTVLGVMPDWNPAEIVGLCPKLVSYADIIYNASVLERLIKSPKEISVVVDTNWEPYWKERFDDPLSDAESLKIDSQGNITSIGQKPDTLSEIEGQYIGLMKFTTGGLDRITASYRQAVQTAAGGGQAWGQSKPVEKAYMTDLLQGLILEGVSVHAVEVSGGWLEIDSLSDYELAKKHIVDGGVRRG